jgi:rhodanese-related sulfurtransferase
MANDEDNDLSNLKYELSLLKMSIQEFMASQEESLDILKKQISKLASGKIVTENSIIRGTPYEIITSEELDSYLDTIKDGIILDVRTLAEWKQSHIEGSLNIPLNELSLKFKELKNKPIFVVCAVGERSSVACGLLVNEGYDEIFNVEGGINNYPGKIVSDSVELKQA